MGLHSTGAEFQRDPLDYLCHINSPILRRRREEYILKKLREDHSKLIEAATVVGNGADPLTVIHRYRSRMILFLMARFGYDQSRTIEMRSEKGWYRIHLQSIDAIHIMKGKDKLPERVALDCELFVNINREFRRTFEGAYSAALASLPRQIRDLDNRRGWQLRAYQFSLGTQYVAVLRKEIRRTACHRVRRNFNVT